MPLPRVRRGHTKRAWLDEIEQNLQSSRAAAPLTSLSRTSAPAPNLLPSEISTLPLSRTHASAQQCAHGSDIQGRTTKATVHRRRRRLHSKTSNCECFVPGSLIIATAIPPQPRCHQNPFTNTDLRCPPSVWPVLADASRLAFLPHSTPQPITASLVAVQPIMSLVERSYTGTPLARGGSTSFRISVDHLGKEVIFNPLARHPAHTTTWNKSTRQCGGTHPLGRRCSCL